MTTKYLEYKPASLWANYIWEREGKKMLERPEGFATYIFLDEHCYIEDIYIVPEARNTDIAQSLIGQIALEAKHKGYTKLLGSAIIGKYGTDKSLSMAIKQGFKLLSANNNMIYYEKEI